MPGPYAHRRFGGEVLNKLPRELRENAQRFGELYDIGLMGPDILFYHDPALPGGLNREAGRIHRLSGREVFTEAYRALRSRDFSPLHTAYVSGALCHFALDCMCHGTIRRWPSMPRFQVETEFERYLLLLDGHDPFAYPVCGNLVPSMRNAAVVSAFYRGTDARDIQRCLRRMRMATDALASRSALRQGAILAAFRLSGRYRELRGLVMTPEPDPAAEESSRRVMELYKLALPLALRLIDEFRDTMEGRTPPDVHYRLNFESETVEREEA